MNGDDLRVRAKQLQNEVRDRTAELKSGQITKAEYDSYIDKAYSESQYIGKTLENYSKALATTSVDVMPETKAVRRGDDLSPMSVKSAMDTYSRLRDAAISKAPNSSFVFELATKTRSSGSQIGLKTNPYGSSDVQGATGLQGEGASGTSVPVGLTGAGSQAAAAADFFLAGPGGPDITPQWVPGILELRWYENVIAQLMPTFPTESPVVSYVRETAWNNGAAATPEGGSFPTQTNTIERYSEQIGKVAVLSHTTDEEIQDSQYYWALIQKRTTMAVTRQEEVQLLAGAGYPGVNGLLNRSSAFTQAQTGLSALTNVVIPNQSNPGVGAESATVSSLTPGRQIVGIGTGVYPDGFQIVEGILAALTDIRINHFFEPTAIVLNPLDAFTIRILKDRNDQYMAGSMFGFDYGQFRDDVSPAIQATENFTLWGKRVVVTPAIPQGLILVGDFTDGAAVLRRGGMRVEIVNTNGYDFQNGLWSMRAYTRVGLAMYRPELFELVSLVNG